jgi:PilZ domain
VPRTFATARAENRIPMTIALNISGPAQRPGVETAFTENVSSRGACVVSGRRWRSGERLAVASMSGDFRAKARVAYCRAQREEGFVIGIEFLEPVPRWIPDALPDSGDNLHG